MQTSIQMGQPMNLNFAPRLVRARVSSQRRVRGWVTGGGCKKQFLSPAGPYGCAQRTPRPERCGGEHSGRQRAHYQSLDTTQTATGGSRWLVCLLWQFIRNSTGSCLPQPLLIRRKDTRNVVST